MYAKYSGIGLLTRGCQRLANIGAVQFLLLQEVAGKVSVFETHVIDDPFPYYSQLEWFKDLCLVSLCYIFLCSFGTLAGSRDSGACGRDTAEE